MKYLSAASLMDNTTQPDNQKNSFLQKKRETVTNWLFKNLKAEKGGVLQ